MGKPICTHPANRLLEQYIREELSQVQSDVVEHHIGRCEICTEDARIVNMAIAMERKPTRHNCFSGEKEVRKT